MCADGDFHHILYYYAKAASAWDSPKKLDRTAHDSKILLIRISSFFCCFVKYIECFFRAVVCTYNLARFRFVLNLLRAWFVKAV